MVSIWIREGEWFAVPLGKGGFAAGLAIRCPPNGFLLASFVGEWFHMRPTVEQCVSAVARGFIYTTRTGYLEFQNGRWVVVGPHPAWSRAAWPVPVLRRYSIFGEVRLVKRLFLDDQAVEVREAPWPPDKPTPSPEPPSDGIAGTLFCEAVLTRYLCDGDESAVRPQPIRIPPKHRN